MKGFLIATGILLLIVAGSCTRDDQRSVTTDLGIMEDIIRKHLLRGGKLARGPSETPRLPETEYTAAFAVIRRDASADLKALLRDPKYRNTVISLDYIIRNYLKVDGFMEESTYPAPGTLTIGQYVAGMNGFLRGLSPELREFLNESDPAAFWELFLRFRRGHN